jgi:hypothetical protein
MRVIPKMVTNAFAFAVAYFLFGLMLLFQIADLVIAIVRAW